MALKSLSGVSHSVANTAKRAVVIVGSAIAFNEEMGPTKAVGCSIAIGGTFLYAIADDVAKKLKGKTA
jgi:solute carrier family 35 protein E1